MHTKRVTLDTIAEMVGISKYSVSRALSGAAGVSDGTRRRVMAAAEALGYRHAAVGDGARSLRGATAVLFLPGDDHQGSEYWLKVMGGVQAEAERLGMRLITRSIGAGLPPGESPAREADGVVIAGHATRASLAPHLPPEVPGVVIGYPRDLEGIDAVTVADRAAGRAVGAMLRDLGHRQLAYVSDRVEPTRDERERGLREVLGATPGTRITTVRLAGDELGDPLGARLRTLVRRPAPPTAIFCSTDVVAFAVVGALREQGMRVPDDVSVVGFNDYAASAHHAPPLTTVRVPMQELGAVAMRVLADRLGSGMRDRSFTHTLVVPEVVVRGSTGPAPRDRA